MAVELTTSFQLVSEMNVYTNGSWKAYIRIYGKYNEPQDIANAQTPITLEQRFWYNQGSSYKYNFGSASATLDGTPKSLGSTSYKGSTEYVIQTINGTIDHYSDGTSQIKHVTYSWDDSVGPYYSSSFDITAPKMDRYPMLTNAPDFNDDGDPTIQYSTTLGFDGASVTTGIFDSTGNTAYVDYRAVNVSNGSYTFNLTNTERTALRSACANISTPLSITYKLKTTYNNVDYISSKTASMTIINGEPTFEFTTTENNAKVTQVFGQTTTYVQNASQKTFTITPSAKKEASITRVEITHNGIMQYKTTAPYTFDVNIADDEVLIKVYDSRSKNSGDTATSLTPYVSYLKADITKAKITRPSATSNDVQIRDFEATYVSSFGNVSNTSTLKYKINNGSYVTIPSSAYTIANNKITMSLFTISNGLPYTDSGNMELYLEDRLTNDTENRTINKGVATFDYGEHDLQVNGELYIADTNRANAQEIRDLIYPVGSIYISVEDDTSAKVQARFGGTWVAFGTGKTLVGYDANDTDFDTIEETGGEKEHTLTIDEMPSHSHTYTLEGGNISGGSGHARWVQGNHQNWSTATTGGSQPHNIMQPYVVVYMWKRTA